MIAYKEIKLISGNSITYYTVSDTGRWYKDGAPWLRNIVANRLELETAHAVTNDQLTGIKWIDNINAASCNLEAPNINLIQQPTSVDATNIQISDLHLETANVIEINIPANVSINVNQAQIYNAVQVLNTKSVTTNQVNTKNLILSHSLTNDAIVDFSPNYCYLNASGNGQGIFVAAEDDSSYKIILMSNTSLPLLGRFLEHYQFDTSAVIFAAGVFKSDSFIEAARILYLGNGEVEMRDYVMTDFLGALLVTVRKN